MRKYISFFRIRFTVGLQYRAAAYAGMVTQFAWGFMTLMMFWAFYKSDKNSFPMSFEQLSSYIWLQQAFLSLFMAWFFENEIFSTISSGNIAYELCRPINLYDMWFIRNAANRLSKASLRALPILAVGALLPSPFRLSLPVTRTAALLFLISIFLGFLVLIAFNMLVYISAFYTVSSMGIRILSISLIELFSGAVIPLPFLPEGVRRIFELMPFASTQNTPFLIYTGNLDTKNAVLSILLQIFWLAALIIPGKLFMKNALKKVVVQGG
ncbi:MAG TPA: ABC transporter permease [Clostridia bacterium]